MSRSRERAGSRGGGAGGALRRGARAVGLLALGALLAACVREEPDLVRLRAPGPDEFAIVPARPLEAPPDIAALPPPAPGGASRAEPTPRADAIAALGGRPAAAARPFAVPARDAAVVAYAGRGGTAPGVRAALAGEDLETRRRGSPRLLERVFGLSTYGRVYRPQSLDPDLELERARAAGLRAPSAPPSGAD